MEFVPVDSSVSQIARWVFAGVFVITLIFLILKGVQLHRNSDENSLRKVNNLNLQILLTGFGLSILAMATILPLQAGEKASARDTKVEAIASVYGLELSDDDFKSLRYPFEKPPVGETIRYGAINDDFVTPSGELARTSITLAWVGDEFKLFESLDDEILGAELPRVSDSDK